MTATYHDRIAGIGRRDDRVAGTPRPTTATTAGTGRARKRAVNATLGTATLLLASAHAVAAWEGGHLVVGTLLVVEDVVLAVLFVCRVQARRVSRRAADWLACTAGATLPLFIRLDTDAGVPAHAVALQVAGIAFALASTVALGRRLGIVPADRGVAARGPYGLVRHPMYGAWLLATVGGATAAPSAANVAIALATAGVLVWRALREEAFLGAGDAYADYRRRVRWRFVPGVF